MRRSTLASILVIAVLIPATLFLGSKLPGRWYYLTSTLIVIETMLPFFFAFETRKPQARELVTIAVMAAIAAASRVAFAFIPHFKPIIPVIMMAGIAFGAQTGFLTGTIAAFASNFFFGQGPWTPWQMMAYGLAGFLAGLLLHKKSEYRTPFYLAAFGFLCVALVIGPLLDSCTLFTTMTNITSQTVILVFAQGIPINLLHGLSCAVVLFVCSKAFLRKLDRLQTKYAMMQAIESE